MNIFIPHPDPTFIAQEVKSQFMMRGGLSGDVSDRLAESIGYVLANELGKVIGAIENSVDVHVHTTSMGPTSPPIGNFYVETIAIPPSEQTDFQKELQSL